MDIGGSDDPWGESNSGSSSLHHTSDPFAPSVPTLESVNGDPWLPPPPNASGKHHHQHHNSNDPWATNGGSSSSSNSASATNPWSAAGKHSISIFLHSNCLSPDKSEIISREIISKRSIFFLCL